MLHSVVIMWALSVPVSEDLPEVSDLPAVHELPSVLRMRDGSPVESADDWRLRRRPELIGLFQHYMYGYLPEAPEIVITEEVAAVSMFEGEVRYREFAIRFKGLEGDGAPVIHLALFTPQNAKAPSPVFLGLNKCGNHTVVDHPAVLQRERAWIHEGCRDVVRGEKESVWNVRYLAERGYALATFHVDDIDLDRPDFSDGVHPWWSFDDVPPGSRWGTIAAWAFGIHRAVDALIREDSIDPSRISLIGHSRRGKTALLAAALDPRVALVVPHQSGTGGCALSRANEQETVERINRVFPHWFNDTFVEFGDREERLPFDQHCLIALLAPRPVLETVGIQDAWAGYESSLHALRAADPVYALLGADGIRGDGLLDGDGEIDPLQFGDLQQVRRDTEHVLDQAYWEIILDFADHHLGEPENSN